MRKLNFCVLPGNELITQPGTKKETFLPQPLFLALLLSARVPPKGNETERWFGGTGRKGDLGLFLAPAFEFFKELQ